MIWRHFGQVRHQQGGVETDFGLHSMGRGDPVDGSLDLTLLLRSAALCRRVVSAMEFDDLAGLRIFRHSDTFNDVRVPEPHFASWGEPEKLFGRIFTEVVLLNIEDA